jgi:galactokinase/mevalonate kinase-like predicted kinase
MPARKPQINFQVEEPLKELYEEARAQGHWVTRLCAAGFLLMIEEPRTRARALSRLRDWEVDFAKASAKEIRAFVEGAQDAVLRAAPGSRPARPARAKRTKPKRA